MVKYRCSVCGKEQVFPYYVLPKSHFDGGDWLKVRYTNQDEKEMEDRVGNPRLKGGFK